MKAIVAVTKDWGIGKENKLLMSIPEDMKFFRETTKNSVVVMGRKTLESFPGGNPLKNRFNIVITRDDNYRKEGVTVVHSVEAAMAAASAAMLMTDDAGERIYGDCFVIGGESIYRQALDYVDTVFVTKMDIKLPADSFFPNLDEDENFKLTHSSENKDFNGVGFRFCVYERA